MSATFVSTSPDPVPAVPDPAEVFAFADREIGSAALGLWPHAAVDLREHVPSVTGYVRRIRVDGRDLYAKYAFLGMSLVSLLRGAGGAWPDIEAQQAAYVRRDDSLMTREAVQLRFLARTGRPRVCAMAGLRRGVLFTESVPGESLAGLLLARPHETAQLLGWVFGELHRLHDPVAAGPLGRAVDIRERSIAGTFQRKFNGLSGTTYVLRLGAERCVPGDRTQVVEVLRRVVTRLRRLQASTVPQTPRRVLAYGDLKPEHVHFPAGTAGEPVFIDPGLMMARASVDTAKLISRLALTLAAARPGEASGRLIARGVDDFAAARMVGLGADDRRLWLREVLMLWLMDSVNILTTYLSAPPVLPVPGQAAALVARAVELCRVVDLVSAGLADGRTDPAAVWDEALGHVQAVAA